MRVNATVADEAAAFVNVTVHVALCPLPNVAGVQLNDDNCGGATSARDTVFEILPPVAVTIALWSAWMAATLAVKAAEAAPAGTVTDPGTETLALFTERLTGKPALGAGPVSVIEHEDDPGALTVRGEQLKLFSDVTDAGCRIVMAPPAAEAGMELPDAFDATTFDSDMEAVPLAAPGATRKATVAICPLPIVSVFNPYRTQVVEPPLVAHATLFAALTAEEPAFTPATDNTDGYAIVHWRLVGSAPPLDDVDRLTVTVDPGVAFAELSERATC